MLNFKNIKNRINSDNGADAGVGFILIIVLVVVIILFIGPIIREAIVGTTETVAECLDAAGNLLIDGGNCF